MESYPARKWMPGGFFLQLYQAPGQAVSAHYPSRQLGRQGACKHNWCIDVLSHILHLLLN